MRAFFVLAMFWFFGTGLVRLFGVCLGVCWGWDGVGLGGRCLLSRGIGKVGMGGLGSVRAAGWDMPFLFSNIRFF